MKKLLVICTILVTLMACERRSDDQLLVESFIRDVQNKEKDYNEIIDSYLCDFTRERPQEKTELIILQLTELRKILNAAEIRIQPYKEVPAEEQTVQVDSTEEVYRILANKQHVSFVLVRDDKIMSFATMKKGEQGRESFITLCD